MSRSNHIPNYSLHKPSGQARVIISGKHHYLGKFGSPESRNKYAALIGKHFHEESKLPESPPGTFPPSTIDELILHYLDHARTYYCASMASQQRSTPVWRKRFDIFDRSTEI